MTPARDGQPQPSTAPQHDHTAFSQRPHDPSLLRNLTSDSEYTIPQKCPVCSHPNIRAVPSVVAELKGTENTIGTVSNLAASAYINTVTYKSQALAEMLAPPASPINRLEKTMPGCAGVIAAFFLVLGVGTLIAPSEIFSDKGFVPIFFAISIWAFYSHRQGVMQNEHVDAIDRSNFQIAQDIRANIFPIWERLYYCPKCHTVHDPANGRTTKPERLSVLYKP